MNSKFEASIVIPTYNKLPRLKLTITSLMLAKKIETCEIIIVNDGSTDGTNEYLEEIVEQKLFDNIQIISITNSGRSAARNVGIKNSTGKTIIFIDDDLIVHPDFIVEHIRLHKKDKIVVRGHIYDLPFLKFFRDPSSGEMINGYERNKKKDILSNFLITKDIIQNQFEKIETQGRVSKFEKDVRELLNRTNVYTDSKYRWICCNGGNFSVSREWIDLVGGFDDLMGKVWGMEDLDLGYRFYLNNSIFIESPYAKNFHLTHFRDNFKTQHKIAFKYFAAKQKNENIYKLEKYFDEKIITLVRWKEDCENK